MNSIGWLLTLEATLFFTMPFWESTAPFAEPASYPFRFGITILAAATVATFTCHIGPALFARKFGETKSRTLWMVSLWLGVGYFEWLLNATRSTAVWFATTPAISTPRPSWLWLLIVPVLLATVTVAGSVKAYYKPFALLGMASGAGLILWALATTWHGLWVRNPHFSAPPAQLDWLIAKGMLLSAAPAIVIAFRLGALAPDPKRIALGGFVGMWVPLVSSVVVTSLADQAGANLYWVPSLFRDFTWALLGRHGRIGLAVGTLTVATLFCPALISVVSLRLLTPLWINKRKLLSGALMLFVFLVVGLTSVYWDFGGSTIWGTRAHWFWAGSLVITGFAAGMTYALRRR